MASKYLDSQQWSTWDGFIYAFVLGCNKILLCFYNNFIHTYIYQYDDNIVWNHRFLRPALTMKIKQWSQEMLIFMFILICIILMRLLLNQWKKCCYIICISMNLLGLVKKLDKICCRGFLYNGRGDWVVIGSRSVMGHVPVFYNNA